MYFQPCSQRECCDYYTTPRGYHKRSGGSNDGWNVSGCQSFLNQPLLCYAHEITNPVLLIHGAVHTALYDDRAGVIPYDNMEDFFKTNLK